LQLADIPSFTPHRKHFNINGTIAWLNEYLIAWAGYDNNNEEMKRHGD
jgi:hypothetical protein